MIYKSKFGINKKYKSPNYWKGRGDYSIKGIVIHKTEGTFRSAHNTIMNPKEYKSYHYLINYFGVICQYVSPNNSAWHCGVVYRPYWGEIIENVNPNLYTIGIGLSGFAKDKTPFQQFTALCELIAYLADRYDLNINDDTIVFHREINNKKTCPGYNISKCDVINFSRWFRLSKYTGK